MIDVRGKKAEPLAQSEDQEDELLSIVAIRKYAISGSHCETISLKLYYQCIQGGRWYAAGNSFHF